MKRRAFLTQVSFAALGALSSRTGRGAQRASWRRGFPFSLGVACGNPSADGFVLWTRLAPDPLCADPATPGGLSGASIPVRYEIALDESMQHIVRHGMCFAEASRAYSVHAPIRGMPAGQEYWYRFASGDAVSRIGRARTFAQPGRAIDSLRFGFVSCSNYEHGYFSAYRHLADDHPDFVVFLGDYIYEHITKKHTVRQHSDGEEAATLRGYRNRYAQYRLDPDLQRLHAEVPALLTWDDHEVQNDYAGEWPASQSGPSAFAARRAAAYQAFYEHMPLGDAPAGNALQIYRGVSFGNLAQMFVLDGRQYRSRAACDASSGERGARAQPDSECAERRRADRSLLGSAQEAWLYGALAASSARWNVLAQDMLMAQFFRILPSGERAYWSDDWNGYPEARSRLLQHVADARVANPVVISGDIHSYWCNDLKLDFERESSKVVATEFVGTSVTSHAPPYQAFARFLPQLPHVRYFESRKRGYVLVELTEQLLRANYRAVSDAADPHATVSTLRSFVVESGRAGAILA